MGNAKGYAPDARGAVGVNVIQIPGFNNMKAHLTTSMMTLPIKVGTL
jgi:hypothetical protein